MDSIKDAIMEALGKRKGQPVTIKIEIENEEKEMEASPEAESELGMKEAPEMEKKDEKPEGEEDSDEVSILKAMMGPGEDDKSIEKDMADKKPRSFDQKIKLEGAKRFAELKK